jgi:hypothetical protein
MLFFIFVVYLNNLVSTDYDVKVHFLEELIEYVNAEHVGNASVVWSPATHLCILQWNFDFRIVF